MEQRRSSRNRTLLQGRVVFNNRFSLIDCTVRDLSETGAQIAFAHPVTLPSELELEIPRKELSTLARVMWSDGKSHGVMFIKAAHAAISGSASAMSAELEAMDELPLQQGDNSRSAPTIQDVLEEARTRIAHLARVPAETVRLKLEVDF
jgi:hypothetical protein